MAGKLGTLYSSTDPLQRAPGVFANAKDRRWRNKFNFADADLTAQTVAITLARLKKGMSPPRSISINTNANLSGINLSVGIAGSAAKYVLAAAGPNATMQTLVMTYAGATDDELTADADIIMTPSGNWPASGGLVTNVTCSHR